MSGMSAANEETTLRNDFLATGIFDGWEKEYKVPIGSSKVPIDVLGRIGNSSWIVECKIPRSNSFSLDSHQIGQAIGQSLIQSYAFKGHYKQNLSSVAMPAICTEVLGSGSKVVKDICSWVGVTIFEMLPPKTTSGDNLLGKWECGFRIYYLAEDAPRHFAKDWSQ